MGRPSKLTDKQWEQIQKRLLAGEKGRALAKEFGVSEAAIRARFSSRVSEIKNVANQLVAAESALKALPVSAQIAAQDYAAQLRSITGHLLGAANYGAATAHRLQAIANAQIQKVDDAEPAKSAAALQVAAGMIKVANEAGAMGLNVVAANRERINRAEQQEANVLPVKVVVQVEDASVPEAQ